MKSCKTREELEKAILEALCSGEPLSSTELLSRLQVLCGEVDKFTARMALAELVRKGVVERIRGDEVRGEPRHLFRCKQGEGSY